MRHGLPFLTFLFSIYQCMKVDVLEKQIMKLHGLIQYVLLYHSAWYLTDKAALNTEWDAKYMHAVTPWSVVHSTLLYSPGWHHLDQGSFFALR